MFCDECGGLGVPVDGNIICNSCGRTIHRKVIQISGNSDDLGPNRDVPNRGGSVFFACPNCGHVKGETYEIPPQYGDEDSAYFVKCSNCGYSRKEGGSKTG